MAKRPKAEIDLTARNRVNEAIDAANRSLKGLERTAQLVTRAFAGLAVIQVGRKFIEVADQAQTLENRLKLVTSSSHELAMVQEELFRISQDTRTSFAGTVELYSRVARATAELGVSQNRLVRVTETINQAMVVSGASAQEAEAALIQLSQGLAAGALRGEELNSVMEQTPRLAQAIAAGMGITIGQLRQMGQEGKITAETVIQALESQGAAIRAEFEQMVPTVGQATTQLWNSMRNLVRRIDEATGSSNLLARGIRAVSREIDYLARDRDSLSALEAELDRVRKSLEEVEVFGESATKHRRARIAEIEAEIERLRAAQAVAERAAAGARAYGDFLARAAEGVEQRKKEAVDALLQPVDVDRRAREVMRNLPDFAGDQARRREEALEEQRKEVAEQLEVVRQSLLSREEVELEALQRRLEIVREARMADLIDDERFRQLSIDLAQRTQERITEIERKGASDRAKFEAMTAQQKTQTILGEMVAMTQGVAQHSKAMFNVNKMAAIADAIVSTHAGVAKTLATYPWPWAGVLAAIHAAAGLARVDAIRRTQFGGGGGVGTTPSAAGSVPTVNNQPAPTVLPRLDRESARGGQTVVNLNIYGTVAGPGGAEQLLDLVVDGLRDRIDERDEIIISPTSRQAADLRG